MTFVDVGKRFCRRVWGSERTPETYWGFYGEVKYALRQARASVYQRLHVLAESKVCWPTPKTHKFGRPQHGAMDYPDGTERDYHIVAACLCGKEWN